MTAPVETNESSEQKELTLEYPATRRDDIVETLHGVDVADPYRWLEDSTSEDTKAWVDAQNVVSDAVLSTIPERAVIRQRIEALWDYDKYGLPQLEGGRYFFQKRSGLQNQSVLYWQTALDAPPTLLLDPNLLSEDGTTSLAGYDITKDGARIAYAISKGGSDWREVRIRDVATGEDLPEIIRWVKFSSPSWEPSGKGFYYSRYDEPAAETSLQDVVRFQKLYYHRIGTEQSDDALIYDRPDQPEWGLDGHPTDDGRYLAIHVWKGTDPKNGLFYKDLSTGEIVELLSRFDAAYTLIHNEGSKFFIHTDRDAPRGRVIVVDVESGSQDDFQELVPQSEATLESVTAAGGKLVLRYLRDARSEVVVHRLDGTKERTIELPAMGTVSGISGKPEQDEIFYSFMSFTFPSTIYRHDLATGAQAEFRRPEVDFEPADFEVKQVFYASKDGTRVPMFIAHKKGIELDGNRPTYLYGYGGFNIPLTPSFSLVNVVWMEMGGVYAMPNLRGGGEYGEEWHQAGTKSRKQNVFDDFIAAAEWLIGEKYTRPERLAIGGRSNGGLLVGASITQRPDLFGAALPGVGVLDMLRFHKFTIGWAWTSDYGSPDEAEDFPALYAYSPYHNLKPGTHYPATLATTADHDDRVVPAHSYKFIAALQRAQAGPAPILISVDTKAGHGAGKPTSKVIDEWADNWGFLVRTLGMRLPADFARMSRG